MDRLSGLLMGIFIIFCGCSSPRDIYKDSSLIEESVPFPHPDNWYLKENHGKAAIELGNSSCSTEICHGVDFKGRTSKGSCYICHSTYPHESGWVYGGKHWQKVLEIGKEQCSGCHGEDFRGGDTGVSCYSCHELYPHAVDWELRHRVYLKTQNYNYSTCATTCHGKDLSGGNSGTTCSTCHYSFPHPGVSNWDDKGHGLYLQSYNFDLTRCTDCHGVNFTGGISGVSCYSCHSTYPHPSGNVWLTRAEAGFHGNLINTSNSLSICAQCHGTDWLGKNSGVSCFTCHSLYPHDSDWVSYNHGDYVNANGNGDCISCHEDQRSSISLDPNSYPNCQYCH